MMERSVILAVGEIEVDIGSVLAVVGSSIHIPIMKVIVIVGVYVCSRQLSKLYECGCIQDIYPNLARADTDIYIYTYI